MFELALLAACMPAQDDWLNDLSSTPPTSSTMHAFRLPVEVEPELVESVAVGSWVAVLELGLPQPAISRLTAPSAATILSGWRKCVSSLVPPPLERENVRLTLMHTGSRVATWRRVIPGVTDR